MMESSSIITERSSVNMNTLYCSTEMLQQHNIYDSFKKISTNQYEKNINCLDNLTEILKELH